MQLQWVSLACINICQLWGRQSWPLTSNYATFLPVPSSYPWHTERIMRYFLNMYTCLRGMASWLWLIALMMEAVNSSECWSVCTWLHSTTSQKKAIFSFMLARKLLGEITLRVILLAIWELFWYAYGCRWVTNRDMWNRLITEVW